MSNVLEDAFQLKQQHRARLKEMLATTQRQIQLMAMSLVEQQAEDDGVSVNAAKLSQMPTDVMESLVKLSTSFESKLSDIEKQRMREQREHDELIRKEKAKVVGTGRVHALIT